MNIKDLYIDFFLEKDHKLINSASIIPENDPTSLFNTAGMQPLIPYLMGENHPLGTRLVNYQKCFRTNDLDSIGDPTHHTFFEMLGNWSLGDYFKKESISWSFEFLTKRLNIPIQQLAVTVFKGNDFVEPDDESANIWMSLGMPRERIAYLSEEDNWWGPAGESGPCGPDTEIFYWVGKEKAPIIFNPEDNRWVEIWNNVFMEYNKKPDGTFIPLEKKNVDTGMGVERITAVLEGVDDNYKTSIWKEVIEAIERISQKPYNEENYKAMRIIADHIRAVVIILGDYANIVPSNIDQGYILRRLIRRSIRYSRVLGIDINSDFGIELAQIIIDKYKKYYPELEVNRNQIINVLTSEKNKFSKTIEKALKEFEKIINTIESDTIDAALAFKLYDTYGFPIELTMEMAEEHDLKVDVEGYLKKFKEHQEKSRAGAIQKFRGGLSSHGEMDTKYHTATHLLNAALKEVLGEHVHQKGSNITPERMRFDFSHDAKMTPEEIKKTEDLVNQYINGCYEVTKTEMTKDEALSIGAEAMFIDKYSDIVNVYQIGKVSKELCGGPHVKNTNELGHFKIIKEEASSAGVRRIKAILE
ncbi:MAG: alanine--tRNA ligase [Bacilli bacterium]|nr:alanine--tRNA ligase [Bacilli bacterium]